MLKLQQKRVEKALIDFIAKQYNVEYERLNFEVPPRIELGEIALPVAFDLAKKVKRAPRAIAQEIATKIGPIEGVSKIEAAGAGYINLYLNRAQTTKDLYTSILAHRLGLVEETPEYHKIVVEHTNINPNKAAHIGHLRNAVIGDTFVRVLKALGYRVETQNYIDNTGVQVADVVVGFKYLNEMTLEEVARIEGKFDYYCWDLYARVTDFYESDPENAKLRSKTLQEIEAGDNDTARMADHIATRIVRAHLATMSHINVEYDLLPRESDVLHLKFWEHAFRLLHEREAIVFSNEGRSAGCWVMKLADKQDRLTPSEQDRLTPSEQDRLTPSEQDRLTPSEQDRQGPSVPSQRAALIRALGPITPSEEESQGEEAATTEEMEKIIVRSDGTVTYVGKDIAYQLWKFGLLGMDFYYRPFQRYLSGRTVWVSLADPSQAQKPPLVFGAADRVYNVIDTRQAYLQYVVVQGLHALGYQKQAENSIHLSYEMVALSPACAEELGMELDEESRARPFIEVSGRKGLGVKADDLIDKLVEKALVEVQARHELAEEKIAEIANKIAVGALRYFLIKFARNSLIAFDFKEALSFEGETGPYLQYSVVRANNIFRKLEEAGDRSAENLSLESTDLTRFLDENIEFWELVYMAARLPEVLRQVMNTMEGAHLAKYAFALAQKFNLFYHKHRIISEPDPEKKKFLLILVDITRKQLNEALELMGIEVPERM